MATLVYGPQAFAVGADQLLADFDADWQKINDDGGGFDLEVVAASDDVRFAGAGGIGGDAQSRWIGTTLVDQKIVADVEVGSTPGSDFPGLMTRMDADLNGYLVEWDLGAGEIIVYRCTGFVGGGGGTYTPIASGGTVSTTTYLNAFFTATGTSPEVALEFGDDSNGLFTFDDSNAARHQSGQPGLSIADDAVYDSFLDNVEIWDESTGAPLSSPPSTHRPRPSRRKKREGMSDWITPSTWW